MKNKKLINSFKYAFTGMWSAYKSERNMKIHIAVAILVILFGVFLQISTLYFGRISVRYIKSGSTNRRSALRFENRG